MTRRLLVTPSTRWSGSGGLLTQDAFNQIRDLHDYGDTLATSIETTQGDLDTLEAQVSALSFPSTLTWSAVQATTSGATKDLTGLPSGIKELVIAFHGVSLSGTDQVLVRLGTSGSFISSGYLSTTAAAATGSVVATGSTSAMIIGSGNAGGMLHGLMMLHNPAGTLWVQSHSMMRGDSNSSLFGGGSVDIGAALTRIRLLASGSDTFDAGAFYVGYRT